MRKRTLGYILKIPFYLIMLGSFIASLYAASKGNFNITYTTSLIIGVVIILYIIGEIIIFKDKSQF